MNLLKLNFNNIHFDNRINIIINKYDNQKKLYSDIKNIIKYYLLLLFPNKLKILFHQEFFIKKRDYNIFYDYYFTNSNNIKKNHFNNIKHNYYCPICFTHKKYIINPLILDIKKNFNMCKICYFKFYKL